MFVFVFHCFPIYCFRTDTGLSSSNDTSLPSLVHHCIKACFTFQHVQPSVDVSCQDAQGGANIILPKKGTPEAQSLTLLQGRLPEKCEFPKAGAVSGPAGQMRWKVPTSIRFSIEV